MSKKIILTPSYVVSQVSFFSATYIVFGIIYSYLIAPLVPGGLPTHVVRAMLVALLAWRSPKFGSATMMGFAAGVGLHVAVPITPAPYLFPSTFAACLAYDLFMSRGEFAANVGNRRLIVTGSMVSGVVDAIVVLAILTPIVFTGMPQAVLLLVWLGFIAGDMLLSGLGGYVAYEVIRRLS